MRVRIYTYTKNPFAMNSQNLQTQKASTYPKDKYIYLSIYLLIYSTYLYGFNLDFGTYLLEYVSLLLRPLRPRKELLPHSAHLIIIFAIHTSTTSIGFASA